MRPVRILFLLLFMQLSNQYYPIKVIRKSEKVKARYDFEARDADDLAFKRGEILDIVSKDEELWWTARNALGKTGSIPVPYIEPVRL